MYAKRWAVRLGISRQLCHGGSLSVAGSTTRATVEGGQFLMAQNTFGALLRQGAQPTGREACHR